MVRNLISQYLRFLCCILFMVLGLGSGGCTTGGWLGRLPLLNPGKW